MMRWRPMVLTCAVVLALGIFAVPGHYLSRSVGAQTPPTGPTAPRAPSPSPGPTVPRVPSPSPSPAATPVRDRGEKSVVVQRGGRQFTTTTIEVEAAPDGRPMRAGSLIVKFRRGAAQSAAHQAVGALSAESLPLPAAARVQVRAGTVPAALAGYRARGDVEYAEPDYIMRADYTPSDQYFGEQWGMTKIGAPAAWDTSRSSSAVRIAILDTGIYGSSSTFGPGHPDVRDKIVGERNFTTSPNGTDDYDGHGTHVAGTAAATTNNGVGVAGVGHDAVILNAKVLGDDGVGSTSWVLSGITWATDNGAKVINMSLGSQASCTSAMQDGIDYAWSRGVVVVVAAGNAGSSEASNWARCNNTLSVAATDQSDNRASFSNYGSSVDVAAPGVSILSTDYVGEYVTMSGTSMASPHVAGLAALIWSTGHGTSNQAVVDRILSTADRVSGTGSYWTAGRVNAALAVQPTGPVRPSELRATSTTNGVVDVQWRDNSSDEDGFQVKRWVNGSWQEVGRVGRNATGYTEINVPVARQYYQVCAYNAVDARCADQFATVDVAGPRPPNRPSNLTTTVEGIDVTVGWTDNATDETGFLIKRWINGGWQEVGRTAANYSNYREQNVPIGTQYYQVCAYNAVDSQCAAQYATAVVEGIRPTTVSPSGQTADTTPTYTWDALAGTSSYRLYVSRWVNGAPGTNLIDDGGLGASAVCIGATCSVTPSQPLADGDYVWWIRADAGPWSTGRLFQIVGPAPPARPSELAGSATDRTVQVTWRDNSNDEEGFQVKRWSNAAWQEVGRVNANVTTFTEDNVPLGPNYYQVCGFNTVGSQCASNYLTVDVTGPQPPARPSALAATVAGRTVEVRWLDNSSDEQGFQIKRWSNGGWQEIGQVNANVTTFTENNVTLGLNYYQVCAFNAAGSQCASNYVVADVIGVPARPSDLTGVVTGRSVEVRWRDNSIDEEGFQVKRWSNAAWLEVGQVNANVTTFTEDNVPPGPGYYQVCGFNAYGSQCAANYLTVEVVGP